MEGSARDWLNADRGQHRTPGEQIRANLEAVGLIDAFAEDPSMVMTDEIGQALARFRSWGSGPVARVFDERDPRRAQRDVVDQLGPHRYDAARRTTLNAHYTDLGYAERMWHFAGQMGFSGGRVLEPGCGAGVFMATAPASAQMVGVELDPVSAAVAQRLNPDATVLQGNFADLAFAPEYELMIGNVPFGKIFPADRQWNPHGALSLHNYFLVKGLSLVKPGGLMVALTSRWTMDAQNPVARREIAALGDFVGAVRLPTNAHQEMAGTHVVTDLVVFRRRADGQEMDEQTRQVWLAPVDAKAAIVNEGTGDVARLSVHRYFLNHPEQVAGRLSVEPLRSMPHKMQFTVDTDAGSTDEIAAEFGARLMVLAEASRERYGLSTEAAELEPVAVAPDVELVNDRIVVAPQSPTGVGRVEAGRVVPFEVPASQRRELDALLGLRDDVTQLLSYEAASMVNTPQMEQLRTELGSRYDAYVRRYGPLNRFTETVTSRVDADTGQPITQRRVPPVMRTFRQDPHAAAVMALEVFDDSTQRATKADIFTKRVVVRRRPRLGAETPAEAVAICMDTDGEVTLPRLAQLLGEDVDTVVARCGDEVFLDPVSNTWMARAEYLSGDIAARIEAVTTAIAANDTIEVPVEQWERQLELLQETLPPPLEPEEISVRLGAVWVPSSDVQEFLSHTLGDPHLRVVHGGGSKWEIHNAQAWGVAATVEWGTERMPAPALAKHLLCQTPIEVRDEVDTVDGNVTRVLNATETLAAQEKGDALNEAFSEWLWSDPQRRERLAHEYNRRFNSLVLRSYDGAHLSLPGLAATFEPRPHQRAAVARMIREPAVGLFHEVGAGKTAEMVMGCMELRRLGLVAKPAVVVPNHMLEQFQREWLQLYPQAKLLAASTQDLAGHKRATFTARTATGDWDGIILTRGSFKRLDVSHDTIRAYMDEEMGLLRRQRAAFSDAGLSVKRLEGQIAAAEERLKRRLDTPRDTGVTFEETGIDYLCIDELHDYKNLATPSGLPGAAIQGSMRASDLHMKLHYLRRTHGQRVITGATATPIANSMSEAFVTQRYLRPDLLEASGLVDFDTWAATFGQVTAALEFTPAGTLKLRARFAKFVNVPELLRMWHMAADVKTAEDLNLPTPLLGVQDNGQRGPETVVIPRSEQLAVYMEHLGERSEDLSARPAAGEDNILVITSDGRKAALDLRLLNQTQQDWLRAYGFEPHAAGGGKVEVAADRIAQIWSDSRDRRYLDALGEPHPSAGPLQLVFCDLGTPGDNWNTYDALKAELVDRGIPQDMVRFIHEAKNDAEKARLFAACRTGQVAVLVGSTQKMGVGTNIQDRAVALHHLDCPWRPADIAQRDGRVIRQGNQNGEVQVIRYVTERSFDAALWDTIARKANFIGQVMKGRLDVREIDDVGEVSLDAAQVAAAVSGDGRLLVKAQLESEVNRLSRLERAHSRSRHGLGDRISMVAARLENLQSDAAVVDRLAEQYRSPAGDQFTMSVDNGSLCTDRADAMVVMFNKISTIPWYTLAEGERIPLCTVGGIALSAIGSRTGHAPLDPAARIMGRVAISDLIAGPEFDIRAGDLREPSAGLIRRLENLVGRIISLPDKLIEEVSVAQNELDRARDQQAQPFKHAELLAATTEQLRVLSAELMAEAEGRDPDEDQTDSTSTAPAGQGHRPRLADFPHSPTEGPHTGRPGDRPQMVAITTSKGSHHDR